MSQRTVLPAVRRHPFPRLLAAALLWVLAQGPLAAVTVSTQQHRFLLGTEGATWGPVLLKAAGSAPFTWSVVAGSLPAGLTLTSAGRIAGAINCAPCAGAYTFTVQVRDATGATAQRAFRIRTARPTHVQTPALDPSEMPMVYTQGAFVLGGPEPFDYTTPDGTTFACARPYKAGTSPTCHQWNPMGCKFDTAADPNRSLDRYKTLLRAYLTRFTGGEVAFQQLETPADFASVRLFQQAVDQVAAEPGGKGFLGLYEIGHLPGFTLPEDLALQPAAYRSRSLRGNCPSAQLDPATQLCSELPDTVCNDLSLTQTTGLQLDITNDQAVAAMLAGLEAAFDHEGPATSSTGPLHGFLLLAEPTLAVGWTGDPWRSIPLYSASARDKFRQYALTSGCTDPFLATNKLPLHPGEFTDTTRIPAHAAFLYNDASCVWTVWRSWVYDTWFHHLDKIARTVAFAQAGNPRFRGTIFFQFPNWYSLTSSLAGQSLTYTHLEVDPADPTGNTAVLRNVTRSLNSTYLATHQYAAHGVPFGGETVFANSVEKLVGSPWIQGFVHENTTPMVVCGTTSANRKGDIEVLTGTCGDVDWYAKGNAVKLAARGSNKLFGMFARYHYFANTSWLSAADWSWNWNNSVAVGKPEMVSVLPAFRYLSRSLLGARQYELDPANNFSGAWEAALLARTNALKSALPAQIPAAWNPPPLGFIDSWNGTTAFGWAFDPWSRQTWIDVKLASGPAGCSNPAIGNGVLGTYPITGTAANDTGIRDFIKGAANYIPPENIPFHFSIDLRQVLASRACPAGSYQLQLVARDRQSGMPGTGKTLAQGGSTNLSLTY